MSCTVTPKRLGLVVCGATVPLAVRGMPALGTTGVTEQLSKPVIAIVPVRLLMVVSSRTFVVRFAAGEYVQSDVPRTAVISQPGCPPQTEFSQIVTVPPRSVCGRQSGTAVLELYPNTFSIHSGLHDAAAPHSASQLWGTVLLAPAKPAPATPAVAPNAPTPPVL